MPFAECPLLCPKQLTITNLFYVSLAITSVIRFVTTYGFINDINVNILVIPVSYPYICRFGIINWHANQKNKCP